LHDEIHRFGFRQRLDQRERELRLGQRLDEVGERELALRAAERRDRRETLLTASVEREDAIAALQAQDAAEIPRLALRENGSILAEIAIEIEARDAAVGHRSRSLPRIANRVRPDPAAVLYSAARSAV